jgi:co-chaperonin GroES (HSP10)
MNIVENADFDKFIMVGDRVLIKPKSPMEKTKGGLLLPPSVQDNERLQCGYVIKVGPGYPIPAIAEIDEPWKNKSEEVKYVPIQPRAGDLAIYMQSSAYEIVFGGQKYVIASQSAILLLIRDESLFD